MIKTGFESRIKIQQIIDSQFPEFILDESPKFVEFLKQYYISQEYQSGPIDISENLDQYLKLDNLIPEVIGNFTELMNDISSSSEIITVNSTKGFPTKYGLLKIDDEIITYTGITTNTFTGCIRGFSGITDYHKDLQREELVFSTSTASPHSASTKIENLSNLFLQEFYKKIKYSLTPELENKDFISELNIGNFIKESKILYQSKGTEESFRILFNILFGETPKIINLEDFLIKSSSSEYIRRKVVVAELISEGDPLKLSGQTLFKDNDSKTTASISEVEIIRRKNKTYYKLSLFLGYDDSSPTITGNFQITGSSRILETVNVGDSVISVDSTIGFPKSGKIYSGNNVITYTDKSVNQFFGCDGVEYEIPITSVIFSDETYYAYEDGDTSKKVELRITGVLSGYKSTGTNYAISVGDKIGVKNLGKVINDPTDDKTYAEIFANSWIYNTSSRYQISTFSEGEISQFTVKGSVNKSSLKKGDTIDILDRDGQTIFVPDLTVLDISLTNDDDYEITTLESFSLSSSLNYDIRRKIKYANSSQVEFDFNPIISDVQNVYDGYDEYMYVAANSLPSYDITKSIFSYNASSVAEQDVQTELYSVIVFSDIISFITGSQIYYKPSGEPIPGLSEGVYYVQVLPENESAPGTSSIRLYASRSVISTDNYISFGELTSGSHNFTLNSQKEKVLSAQKILRKFPLSINNGDGESDLTTPGSTGMLINGVEIFNYKTTDKIYYGPLKKVNVLNGGYGYDVINPPLLQLSSGSGLVQPIVNGSVEKVYVTPQEFNLDVLVSIAITGGNGSGAVFEPVIERRRREIEFDARQLTSGGGVDIDNETITFLTKHNLVSGQEIIYRSGDNSPIGIWTFGGSNNDGANTLKDESTYYAKYISDTTIQLYQSLSDYNSGINTVGFTTIGTYGIQKFATEVRNVLKEIKVINGGNNYSNRKLRVLSSGISTTNNTVTFSNHGFKDGELITYSSTGNIISGLSTTNQYYILKVNDDSFKISDAGVAGTIRSNYERRKFVSLGSTGSGYHIFNYPEISIKVEYNSTGIDTSQIRGSIEATPVVRGKIEDVYVYNNGSDYGSIILNNHNKPSISIKTGKDSQFTPVIINGRIVDVAIQYGGTEYYSEPDLQVYGSGVGAVLRPVVTNNKITDVIIINTGYGYSTANTTIIAVPAGRNAILESEIRSLTVNNNVFYNDVNDTATTTNELILSSYNNLQYGVCGYSGDIQNEFNDNGEQHSPIIGWAYDGNPIYGSYGYSNPRERLSIKKLVSGYSLNPNNITNRPSEFSPGFFIEDYQFTNSGDLDEYNGRFCITDDFPNGIYAYFATSIEDGEGNNVGSFPYFIGNRYRSKFINENQSLDQSFDFNNSTLIRNTLPYRVNEKYGGNDFIVESNEIINQEIIVESVTSGSIDNFDIISSGKDYRVGDDIKFNETGTGGGGLISKVSEVTGKQIVTLDTSTTSYDDVIFVWDNSNTVIGKISPKHNLENLDYVSISGFSTSLSFLNDFKQIGVVSYTSTLIKDIPAYSLAGIVTDIYISRIPENVSIGSSLKIESETLKILNIFETKNIIRVRRETTGTSHTSTSAIYFIPDKFTVNADSDLEYFDSSFNNLIYFNPNYSIGVGTISGVGVSVDYNIGISTNNSISIPTQTIYLPNHSFSTNQAVTLRKPSVGGAFLVSNTSGGSTFNLPDVGDSQTVYVIKKSSDYIGIVTQIGLTTTTSGLFFTNNGSNNYEYSLESNFNQIKGNVKKVTTSVSVSTSHNLVSGDTISLLVKPNLSVGIGTSNSIKVLRDINTDNILINPIGFNSSGINTETSTITINSHNLVTGDKVKYTANSIATGLSTGFYFVYKVDENKIKLSETYIDCAKTIPPNTISITGIGGSSQNLYLVNPKILSVKNNNLVFDLSDSSLLGYNFKIFYDINLKDEFVSTGSTTTFTISGVGTVGLTTNASLTINYGDKIPSPLFYGLEKNGIISIPDKEVINYSQINFIDSYYNNSYKISGVGTTSFNVFLTDFPEKTSYDPSECDILEYKTTSTTSLGEISKIRTISPGLNYKKLPIFDEVTSEYGSGAYIIPKSNDIGRVNEIRISNEGFEYASDKTLTPEASISKFVTIKDSNTINSVEIIYGGRNYLSQPNLIIINSETGEKIDSGILIPSLTSGSIDSILIDSYPKGLPESTVTIKSVNNTNGVGIKTVQASSSGIITCVLSTPSTGFGIEPFSVGDKVFIEGIQKEVGSSGDGFNSEDYGYEFFEVDSYVSSSSGINAILRYNISGLTTNPGTPKSIDNIYGTIINYNVYPQFKVTQSPASFNNGESLDVKIQDDFSKEDLRIVEYDKNYLKISGSYNLKKNQIIRGTQSGSIAIIDNIQESSGFFLIDYSLDKRIGWYDDTGKLDTDTQVIPDNDYYQNLSYSIKSNQEWEDIVSPVGNILHPVGMKNFSDTEIIQNVGIRTTFGVTYDDIIVYITNENRVDTINNYDLTLDVDNLQNTSKFLKFTRKKFSDYLKCITNRVLDIDDISSEFSSSNQIPNTSSKITDIELSRKFNRYLVQISDKNYSQFQLTELIVLNTDSDTFTLERGTINSGISTETGYQANSLGDVYGYLDPNDNYYLKFEPLDPYTTSYNVKYLNTTFTNYTTGIGTVSVGFVNLIGVTSTVSSGSTISLLNLEAPKTESLFSTFHLINNLTNEMNYVEIFIDHDQNEVSLSEFYFDSNSELSSNFIGTFGASINSGILTLNYTNNSSGSVTVRSRNVGFGTTSTVGISSIYRFKQIGQIDGFENTVNYDSRYTIVSSDSTILSFNNSNFSSVKSTIKVSVGNTSSLHQVLLISDGTNVSTLQYPFLSIGSTIGIGTFGGEISGSDLILKFYPDNSISGTFDILSFNESFYKENDYINDSPDLTYSNILENVGVSRYFSVNDEDINRLNFELNYRGTSIFSKTFDPADSSILNPSDGEFNISNHFFSTGEELIYTPNTTFVGVAVSSVGIGTTTLPNIVYAIKVTNDKFKIATTKANANAGISVTFSSVGSGNAHQFEMVKKNEKSIITINNIVQEPLSFALLDYTVNNGSQISVASTTFGLGGISSIRLGDVLKIDNEYMKVINVGLGTTYSGPISFAGTFPLVNVERGFVGSISTTHSDLSSVQLYRGSYNIVGNEIHFTEPPEGNIEDQLFDDVDNLPEQRAYFNGRVFLRKDYTTNKIYDNISEKFTGLGQTYTLTVGGANTVGLGTSGSSGLLFINGVFQQPTTENNPNNNFTIIEDTISGISSVVFSGITSVNGSIVVSQTDVNLNQLPRGGIIVSLGSSGGLGYAPIVGASVTAAIGAGGSIFSIGIGTTGNWGSGYRNPVSVAITESGHTGSAATITATVGAGGTLSFIVVGGGTGYINPTINISPPNYSNLPITGVSRLGIGSTTDCGIGLLLNIEVGASSTTGIGSTLFEVKNFNITRNGYGFKKGDVVKPVGLVTAYGLSSPISEFELTILDDFTDSFSSWQFGELDYIDSVKKYQDGSRTRFPLYYNGNLLSFEKDENDPDSQLIDFNQLLIIFVNGILQKPEESYQFNGGTSFQFLSPPKTDDEISIYFYRGSSDDSIQFNVFENLKVGDDVTVFSNNNYLGITTTQNTRTVYEISTSDTIETNLYTGDGIDSNNLKPISWTKQKIDKVINGYNVSKARNTIEPQIYPTAKIIKSLGNSDGEIFVDNVGLFNYEGVINSEIDFDLIVIDGKQDPVSASVTAVVSTAGTIQSLSINSVGSGYTGSSVDVSIASPLASIVGFGTTLSVSIGTTATASVSIVNGSLSTFTITNPGSGYTSSNPPQVIIPLPDPIYENITNVTGIAGTIGNIIGIGTTVGVGTDLAIKFTLQSVGSTQGLSVGNPIYIFNTIVGNGVTSIINSNSEIVGIGTTCLDNIYYISGISVGIITCNIHSQTSVVGLATTGSMVGKFSWGKLSSFSRSLSPISIGVSGFTVDSGLSTFPTVQRRTYGFRSSGSIQKSFE